MNDVPFDEEISILFVNEGRPNQIKVSIEREKERSGKRERERKKKNEEDKRIVRLFLSLFVSSNDFAIGLVDWSNRWFYPITDKSLLIWLETRRRKRRRRRRKKKTKQRTLMNIIKNVGFDGFFFLFVCIWKWMKNDRIDVEKKNVDMLFFLKEPIDRSIEWNPMRNLLITTCEW